jgi:hypothetical protein
MDEEERSYTLEETIQNYYAAMNSGWEEDDYAMLAWLEELRDLRAILNERAPGEAATEAKAAKYGEESLTDDDPFRLIDFLDSMSRYTGSPEEEQMVAWAEQLLKARDRVQKDKTE